MKQTVTESMFIDSFPESYKDNFSYEGKKALFEYLEELEEGCNQELELDPIALCCEYSEYESALDAAETLTMSVEEEILEDAGCEDDDEIEEACMDWLRDNTMVIEHPEGIIIQDF